jgi:hypothetical protein
MKEILTIHMYVYNEQGCRISLERAEVYFGFQIVAEFRSFLAPTLLVPLMQSQMTGATGTKTVHNDHCSERKR